MSLHELAHFVDRVNAVQVALALSPSPGKQSMAPEEDSFSARIALHCSFEHECQLETWTLPGQPYNPSPELAIELFQLALAIGACRDGNSPIGMKMVNVVVRNKCVQRRINGRSNFVFAKSGEWVVPDHFVLEFLSAIEFFQAFETIEIEERETRLIKRSNVPPAALDCQHAHRLAGKRIG